MKTLKMMKNAYFILRSLFVLKIFVLTFLVMRESRLIRKLRLILKFKLSQLGNKQIQDMYCPLSQEVKTIRQ